MSKVTLLLATMALAVVLTALPAQAATFTVNSTTDAPDANKGDGVCDSDSAAPGGQCTLRAAIEEANNPSGDDIIGFDPSVSGTITLGGTHLVIGSNLKIEGPGADKLSVDANGLSRVFYVQSGTVGISGLTITGGKTASSGENIDCREAYLGGGVLNKGTLTLSDATVSENRGLGCYGGGIHNLDGDMTVERSAISDNSSPLGGGVSSERRSSSAHPELTITDSTISGNSALRVGAGLYNLQSRLTVSNSTISENTAGRVGGGIRNNGGDATVSNTTISGNTTEERGGGIANLLWDRGSLSVERSTISGNTAASNGGGIYSETYHFTDGLVENFTVTNSTISSNTATNGYGGGLYNSRGLTQIGHSTITGNTAPAGKGGGVASLGDAETVRTEVYSSIVSANEDTDVDFADDPGWVGEDFDFVNTFSSEGYNLVGDGNAASAFDQSGDQAGVSDPLLGPLQDNGGPTETHLPLEVQGSPVIDQGKGTEGLLVDQRGQARPHDHPDFANAQGSDGSDIGAVEVISAAEPPPPPPPPNQACTIKGTGGKDVLRGTARRDVICAYSGNDTIKGMGGNDRIMGGSGRDTMAGGAGDDRLYGGPGGDELNVRDGSGGDLANGGRGDDTCSADRGDRKRNCS